MQASLCSLPLMKDHIEHTLPPSMEMQQRVCVPAQGSPLETQCPNFYRGLAR